MQLEESRESYSRKFQVVSHTSVVYVILKIFADAQSRTAEPPTSSAPASNAAGHLFEWSLGVGAEGIHRRIKDYLRLCKSCFVQAYSAGLAGDTQRF